MNYLKVKWNHAFPDEPVLLYSEIDGGRWETRKVEIFPDGTMGFAEKRRNSGKTELGEVPLPELLEIASDPQFEPIVILQPEFEVVWLSATSSPPASDSSLS